LAGLVFFGLEGAKYKPIVVMAMFEAEQTNLETEPKLIRLEEVIHSLLEVALYLLQARRGCIMMLNSSRDRLEVKFAKGYRPEALGRLTFALDESVAGWVARTGKPLAVPSVDKEPLFVKKEADFADGQKVKTLICAPLRLQEEVVGVVNIDADESRRAFGPKDLSTLAPIVQQMGKALELAKEAGGSKIFTPGSQLISLGQIVHDLNMVYSEEELGPIFLSSMRALFPQADSGMLLMETEQADCYQLLTGFGEVPEELNLTFSLQPGDSCILKDKRKAVLISDRTDFIASSACKFISYQAKSMLITPLVAEEKVKGMMVIGSSFPNSFREHDLHLLQIISGQISLLYRTGTSYWDLKIYAEDMLDSVSVGVIYIDLVGRITMVNQQAEKILGTTKEQLVGKFYQEYNHCFDLEKFQQAKLELLATGEPQNIQLIFQIKDKTRKILSLGMNLLRNRKKTTLGITLVFEDITERLLLEEQLRRTERLVVAGQLAAGAAHEIKNPLTTIKGFCQFIRNSLPEGDGRINYLDTMLSEAEQINNIINEMDRLAENDLGILEWLDLPMLLDEVLQEERKEGSLAQVAVKTAYDRGIPPVLGNQLKLKQVFFHIIKNGLQSMPEGGRLVIKVWVEPAGDVGISFSDTGAGIPEEERELIFNPFYTSKPERIGLGLAVSYKTIREHGGTMKIDSMLGEGTTVSLRLPVNFRFADLVRHSGL
jgi:PAS domain S-box-containing protein